MKYLILIILVVAIYESTGDLENEWIKFKKEYKRSYSLEEDAYRKIIFTVNSKKIEKHNQKYKAGISSFYMDINEFTDMTDNEYELKMSRGIPPFESHIIAHSQNFTPIDIPESVNWVDFGYNNPILNQGSCGSCYSFAAVAALEGQYYIKHKKLIKLSQQELVDCGKSDGNYGCGGGWQKNVYKYILANGIGHSDGNPYKAKEGKCIKSEPRITISTFYQIPYANETALKHAVATVGPIPIDMDSTLDTFKFYKSGVFYDSRCTTNKLVHAITIVGYGTMSNGQDYWLVRNSWGAKWGDKGYIKMARNKNNHCGVATRTVYPIVN